MSDSIQERFSLEELLRNLPEADWVREMREHLADTGMLRPEDVSRILGDPSRGVEMPRRPDCLGDFGIV
ncbi:MAG: hypothetical protein ABSG68_12520 [Thermoguttaceae bacterium]|jgi:hypothetical protein